jgi:phage major head subunit gpT-like protein
VIRYGSVAAKIMADDGTGLYAAMDDLAPLTKKQAGSYQFDKASSFVYSLESDYFGIGLRMAIKDVRDDKLGIYATRADALGRRQAKFPDDEIFSLLKEGDTATYQGRSITWIDGQNFFSTTHNMPNDVGVTFSNLITGSALTAANFQTAYARLMTFPDSKNKKLGLTPNKLIVAPANMKAGADILLAPTIAAGGYNVQSNEALQRMGLPMIELVVVPELAGDDGIWYLAAVEGDMAPMIYQVTEEIILQSKTAPTDDNVFYNDEFHWLLKGRVQFGWGDPRRIVRSEA